VDHDGTLLVLTRALRGTTLRTRVAEIGRKHAVDAVRTALRVADGLAHLHDAGIAHGRVNPDNVLLSLEEGVEPTLVFGARSSREFLPPDRGSSDSPVNAGDDAWAATALLYFMLCGSPPPGQGLATLSEVEDLRIDDSLLCDVLLHGLAKDSSKRAKNIAPLRRELARWFIAHAADEPIPVGNFSHKPPPLPPSIAPKVRRSLSPRNGKSKPPSSASLPATRGRPGWVRALPWAAGAAAVGLGVAWGFAQLTKSVLTIERAVLSSAAASNAATAGPIDLAEVPVTGKESDKDQSAGDSTASCVKGYLREGTLTKTAQLDAICKESDLPHALGTLRLAFVSSTGAAPATAARFDNLGWYSLPLLAGLRNACWRCLRKLHNRARGTRTCCLDDAAVRRNHRELHRSCAMRGAHWSSLGHFRGSPKPGFRAHVPRPLRGAHDALTSPEFFLSHGRGRPAGSRRRFADRHFFLGNSSR
jgi:hypothetical protein